MTELERARENLLHHQTRLRLARNNGYSSEVEAYEAAQVLAALSWVWDAQERAKQLSEPVWYSWDFGTEDSWHKRMFMAAKATAEVLDASQGA